MFYEKSLKLLKEWEMGTRAGEERLYIPPSVPIAGNRNVFFKFKTYVNLKILNEREKEKIVLSRASSMKPIQFLDRFSIE